MKIKFLGGARTVTGSCYLVDTGKIKFLVDCGMFQGTKKLKELNYGLFDFEPEEIEFVLLTHAHIDHSGLIPKLVKHGFKGKIYCTSATLELLKIMLPDSGHIQEMEIERKNRKNLRAGKPLLEPIYTVEDAKNSLSHLVPVEYDEKKLISPNVAAAFQNAGHILGSAIIELWLTDEQNQTVKVVFSGDLGDYNQPIVNDPTIIEEADYIVVESTYGSRIRAIAEDKKIQLLKIIKETMAARGNLIIPAFAIERTQDLLYYLSLLEQEGHLNGINLFVDSPLAISATEIFCNNEQYFNTKTLELADKTVECPFILPGLRFTRSAEESMELNRIRSGAIIISASGMCDAGRIKHHLKHNLWRKESTILFVGYQAVGTLGRRILNGEEQVKIHGEEINVKARIANIEGFSAHADQLALFSWLEAFKKKPAQIIITHGEEENALEFAKLLETRLDVTAVVPERLEEIELSQAESIDFPDHDLRWIQATIASVREELLVVSNSTTPRKEIEQISRKLAKIETVLAKKLTEEVS